MSVIIIPDNATVAEAAAQLRPGLHLVIDKHGKFVITPRIFPGMQPLHVAGERQKVAA